MGCAGWLLRLGIYKGGVGDGISLAKSWEFGETYTALAFKTKQSKGWKDHAWEAFALFGFGYEVRLALGIVWVLLFHVGICFG